MNSKKTMDNRNPQEKRFWEKKGIYILLPCVALLLTLANQIVIFILYIVQINKIVNFNQDIQFLLESVQRYLDYSEQNAISTILGLFATVVSVWVSLSIYNIVEKKDVEKTKKDIQELNMQIEALMNDYSTFNMGSLKYIEAWEDRINAYYTEQIWNIIKGKHSAYELCTAMVCLENFLHCVVDRFNDKKYFQMKDYLKKYKDKIEETKTVLKQIKSQCFLTEEESNVLDSYITCRKAEYFYYSYFRDDYYGKETTETTLKNACEYFERALNLCEEANRESNGYIDNALAFLYYQKYTKFDKSESVIEMALNYSKRAVSYDSHYARNYRNYGVNLEKYAEAAGGDRRKTLELAKKQYEKAIEYEENEYNNYIAYVSSALKIADIDLNIAVRNMPVKYGISEATIGCPEEIFEEMNRCYIYLTLAIRCEPKEPQAHYHMIHVLMYLYLCVTSGIQGTFSKEEIIALAKTHIINCNMFFSNNSKDKRIIAFLFKSRNFYEAICDYKEADKYNKKILDLNQRSQDAKNLKDFYRGKIEYEF